MTESLTRHIGRCYETRVMGKGGRYSDALRAFRGELAISPMLKSAAAAERARLETFFASIPQGEHRRCTASAENLQTLKDALNVA